MIEINEKSKVKVKIYGREYDVEAPTVKQVIEINKAMKGHKDDDIAVTDLMIDFVSKLGIPKEMLESLEIHHFNKLVEGLVGSKKN